MLNDAPIQETAPQPPAPPGVPQVTVGQNGTVTVNTGTSSPAENLRAARAYREELQDQRETVRSQRSTIASATREDNRNSVDIAGLEARLKAYDERLLNLEKQISIADERVAQASGVPGAVQPDPPPVPRPVDWEEVFAGGALLSFALLFPFAIAYSRRIWRRSAKMQVTLPPDVATRMQAMEEAIESVAVEVERIGEGQRFMTQALGAGSAEAVPIRARELVHAEQHR